MTAQEIANNIKNVTNTLDTITVSGEANLNRLLGCILLLKKLEQEARALPDIEVVEMDEAPVEEAPVEEAPEEQEVESPR